MVMTGDCFDVMPSIKPGSINCIIAAQYLDGTRKWSKSNELQS